ncbi:MAG: DUF2269 domain-containing protein [Candidatus Eremiobacteraeota bacterium]|nr:DUF2269 domain-containing protein [Candidatus Eremiobacteraeota bacterium]
MKLIHVLAVIMFVGNISVGVFWKAVADRTKDPKVIAHTMGAIRRADRIFTIPGVILLFIAGLGAAAVARIPVLSTGWTLWSLGLLIIAGLAFGPVARTQRKIAALTSGAGRSAAFDWTAYSRLSRLWRSWGLVALAAPIIAVALMVLKPALPAFHATR